MAHTATPRLRRTALLIGLIFPAGAAFAQEQQLGSVVVSATGFEQKITDAPASISVVTRKSSPRSPT